VKTAIVLLRKQQMRVFGRKTMPVKLISLDKDAFYSSSSVIGSVKIKARLNRTVMNG
jgi:hypothetical protein